MKSNENHTHTPGPWIIEPQYGMIIQDKKGNAICHMSEQSEMLFNLHLIAAAPALLEALKEYLQRRNNKAFDNRWQDFDFIARATIARAEGKGE